MSTAYNGRVFNAQVIEQQPIEVLWDGQVLDSATFGIVAGTEHFGAALDLVRFASRPPRAGGDQRVHLLRPGAAVGRAVRVYASRNGHRHAPAPAEQSAEHDGGAAQQLAVVERSRRRDERTLQRVVGALGGSPFETATRGARAGDGDRDSCPAGVEPGARGGGPVLRRLQPDAGASQRAQPHADRPPDPRVGSSAAPGTTSLTRRSAASPSCPVAFWRSRRWLWPTSAGRAASTSRRLTGCPCRPRARVFSSCTSGRHRNCALRGFGGPISTICRTPPRKRSQRRAWSGLEGPAAPSAAPCRSSGRGRHGASKFHPGRTRSIAPTAVDITPARCVRPGPITPGHTRFGPTHRHGVGVCQARHGPSARGAPLVADSP